MLVFTSADPDYFISHVDLTRVAEYRAEAAKLTGEASIALLFRHLSASRLVTIAQIEGRVRGAGSEFVLACDMRFAARETAIFAQFEPAFGLIPGGGATQYLVRVMGRARALEVLLSADDYDAELAERYGWINRALPADTLGDFVTRLAHRIAAFPAAGHVAIKDRVNAISLAPADDFRRDSDLFGEGVRNAETQRLIQAALARPPDPRRGDGTRLDPRIRRSELIVERDAGSAERRRGAPGAAWLAPRWAGGGAAGCEHRGVQPRPSRRLLRSPDSATSPRSPRSGARRLTRAANRSSQAPPITPGTAGPSQPSEPPRRPRPPRVASDPPPAPRPRVRCQRRRRRRADLQRRARRVSHDCHVAHAADQSRRDLRR